MYGNYFEEKIIKDSEISDLSVYGLVLEEKYRVIAMIGAGGFAKVYKVLDLHIQKEYAMKVIENVMLSDDNREIRIMKNLTHKGLPMLHDVFMWRKSLCIVMELVSGVTLEAYVKEKGRLSVKETKRLAMELCEILCYMHTFTVPVIHGDIKPQNIMITPEGLKLIDLGGAFFQFSKQKYFYGTIGYMAPEVEKGDVFTRSDVYSVGKVMLYMLTGRMDFAKENTTQISRYRHYGIPLAFIKIIKKCLQPQPEERYASCKELLDKLKKMHAGRRYFPGHILWLTGDVIRVAGIIVMFFALYLHSLGVVGPEEKVFFLGMYVILLGCLPDILAVKSYKTAILECECGLVVTDGIK